MQLVYSRVFTHAREERLTYRDISLDFEVWRDIWVGKNLYPLQPGLGSRKGYTCLQETALKDSNLLEQV